jgi:tRNA (cmo5U34)-methyltransferase
MNTLDVRDHFRRQVPHYEALMRRLIPGYDQQRDLVLALMPSDRDAMLRVLDLGCGPGLMAARILEAFPSARLTLFDLTSEMIDECRSRLHDRDRVCYHVGDFRTDDFGHGYDVIVASLSLHHLSISERPGFAQRAFASLSPGGCLIAVEAIVDESPAVRERQYKLWRRHMTEQGEDGNAWFEKHREKDHPVEMPTWLATLSAAGFTDVGCFWRYLNFAIVSARRARA